MESEKDSKSLNKIKETFKTLAQSCAALWKVNHVLSLKSFIILNKFFFMTIHLPFNTNQLPSSC